MYLLHFMFVSRLFIKSTNCIGSCVRFEHLFWVGLLRAEMWSNLAELNKVSFSCNNPFNPCPFSTTHGSWLPRSWVLQPLTPCVGASLEEHVLDQWQSSTQPRSNGHLHHKTPLSSHLKVGEQGVGLFEQGDQLAHRLAQVVVAHPEQGLLARGRWDSSKAGWLERPGGKRHLVANHLWCKIEQIKGVCCEGSVPALPWRDRGKQQELSRATIHLYNMYPRYTEKSRETRRTACRHVPSFWPWHWPTRAGRRQFAVWNSTTQEKRSSLATSKAFSADLPSHKNKVVTRQSHYISWKLINSDASEHVCIWLQFANVPYGSPSGTFWTYLDIVWIMQYFFLRNT